jgi:hypothetical protein
MTIATIRQLKDALRRVGILEIGYTDAELAKKPDRSFSPRQQNMRLSNE